MHNKGYQNIAFLYLLIVWYDPNFVLRKYVLVIILKHLFEFLIYNLYSIDTYKLLKQCIYNNSKFNF